MLLLLGACAPITLPVDDTERVDSEVVDDTEEPDDTEVIDTGNGLGPLPYPTVEYDCDNIPDTYEERVLNGARAYHGMAFDTDGSLIGWDGWNAITKTPYEGDATSWVPGFYGVEQIVRHPNGDLYTSLLDHAEVYRFTPDGGSERITGGLLLAYGMTLGPDGMFYVSDGHLHRMDPETGELERLLSGSGGWSELYRDVAFSLDSTVMYIVKAGTGSEWIYKVDLDEDLNLIGEPERFANVPGQWKDGVQVDACGYLWVPEYQKAALFRISPDGKTVDKILATAETGYGHGTEWGTGIGGWREDAIYLPLPYNSAKVRELVIGVPDGRLVRTWKGEKSWY